MDFVVNKLKSQKIGDQRMWWWGGATDKAKEGKWVWTESGLKVESFVWGEGEPNGSADLLCLDSKFNFSIQNPFNPACN